jgi:ubiquinone biosynthesis monooxygenase Coq7
MSSTTADRTIPADWPAWLVGELRSDHAGETGAVRIYDGILAVSRDPAVRDFATRHRATEQGHLDLLEDLLPPAEHSRLLPVWRVAGWLTGALPALFGPRAVFATVDAVETFVDHHYRAQTERLAREGILPAIHALLEKCREEEVHHRDEAREAGEGPAYGPVLRAWAWVVGSGSAAAVAAAKRI